MLNHSAFTIAPITMQQEEAIKCGVVTTNDDTFTTNTQKLHFELDFFENQYFKNVDSLLKSLLSFYFMDTKSNFEYLYYYFLCFVNLKKNEVQAADNNSVCHFSKLVNLKKNEVQAVAIAVANTVSTKEAISDEAQWLQFITSLTKPKDEEVFFVGNEMEYSLDKYLKESEMEEIKNLFLNKYPKHDIISRTWYKVKPSDKNILARNIEIVKKVFKESSMILFYEKIKCSIRNDNMKEDSWEVKIKVEEIKNSKGEWQVKIKECLEVAIFFGNTDEHSARDKLYLGSIPLLTAPPWSKIWNKKTEYYCIYPFGDTNQRLALDITNNKLKYECENETFFAMEIQEIANCAHNAFKNLLGSNYWQYIP